MCCHCYLAVRLFAFVSHHIRNTSRMLAVKAMQFEKSAHTTERNWKIAHRSPMHTLRENESWAYTQKAHTEWIGWPVIYWLGCVRKPDFFMHSAQFGWKPKTLTRRKFKQHEKKKKPKTKQINKYDIFHTSRRWTGVTFHCMEWIFLRVHEMRRKSGNWIQLKLVAVSFRHTYNRIECLCDRQFTVMLTSFFLLNSNHRNWVTALL